MVSEGHDFDSLVGKLRELSLSASAHHLSGMIAASRAKIRDISDSIVLGHLAGSLSAPGQISRLLNVGRQGSTVILVIWAASLHPRSLAVTRSAGCCSVVVNNSTRSISCRSRVLMFDSLIGPSHEAICSVDVNSLKSV